MQVPRGEIFGLLGRNGAGKTTLLRILTTLIPPSSGTVQVLGHDVVRAPLAVRKSICVVLQENAVEIFLSVEDNFATYGRFHGIPKNELRDRAAAAMEQFGLTEVRRHKVIDLSGGMKRRVQVAKVFMVDRPVVFLDEATTGMDPINKRATLDAVLEQARRGRTILLTTHILQEAEELCDRIAIIDRGRLIASGDLGTIKAMVADVIDLTVTYTALTEAILAGLRALPVLRCDIHHATVTLGVRGTEALDILSRLPARDRIVHFEAGSASLEEVFLEILGRQEARA
jgi:ABC-2 type transport system ATP-binding protein